MAMRTGPGMAGHYGKRVPAAGWSTDGRGSRILSSRESSTDERHFAVALEENMKVCPTCRRCFEDAASACVDRSHPALARGPSVALSVGGRWRIERLVEASEEGAEFLGRHIELGRPVEIRVSTGPASAAELGRTRMAARALAEIRQENTARIEDFGSLPGGGSYAAVERFGDETLRDALDRLGPLGVPEAALLARQIAESLAALAAHGTSPPRRALSSEEIGVGRGSHGEPIATIICFPNDEPDDAEEAVLRVGSLLYEMLSGNPPVFSDGGAPVALRTLRPDVPESLASLVMQSVHRSPSTRPRSPSEIARRLRIFERAPDARSAWSPPPPSPPQPSSLEIVVEDSPGADSGSESTVAVVLPKPTTSRAAPRRPRAPAEGWTRPMDAGAALLDAAPAGKTAAFEAASIVRSLEAEAAQEGESRRRSRSAAIFAITAVVAAAAAAAVWYARTAAPRNPGGPAILATPSTAAPPEPTVAPEGAAVVSAEHPAAVASPASSRTRPVAPAPSPPRTAAAAASPAAGDAALRDALAAWLASTNSHDLSGQMRFYMPRLSTFYLERSVSRDTVRRVKSQLFALGPVSVHAGEPQITLTEDGRAATMRFRKSYVLGGPNGERRGAVLQELRWVMTGEGWKIISERDAKVLDD
ncbi:MAG: hypothetical protein ABI592_13115 [Acidobacteriota bacterium]